MKKIFTLVAAALMAVGAQAQVESYVAVTYDADANTYTASAEFTNAVIADGKSIVKFGTDNMQVEAVGGTTAKDVFQEAGTDFAGWTEWNDVKWELKNHLNDGASDLHYGMITGTGNPAMEFDAEEVLDGESRTGHYRPAYKYYTPDCGKMPVQGLYYKFTAKAAGELKIFVWSNKNSRNTFLVDEATTMPVAYKAEGYINGQNDGDGKKKWLTAEDIQAIHDAAKCQKDEEGNIIPDTDSAPYVIGAGNQPFWGNVVYTMAANQTVWLFQDSSQIGFHGYEFTADASAINNISVAPVKAVTKAIQNGRVVIMKGNNTFNVAGQLVK